MTSGPIIDRFNRLFLRERGFVDARDRTPEGFELKESRQELAEQVQKIGKSGDLDLILAVERRFLENDLAEYSNSKAMRDSLNKAILELSAAEKLLPAVRDPAAYRAIDEGYSLPKNRTGGVPHDEARQFFGSHDTRLVNMDKSRLDADEKAIIEQRKLNIRAAEKIYTAQQKKTLGIARAAEHGQDLSR